MIDWWVPVFHEAYAASELGWVSHIYNHEALQRPGSAGRALGGVEILVLSAEGQRGRTGHGGAVVRSPSDHGRLHPSRRRKQLSADGRDRQNKEGGG